MICSKSLKNKKNREKGKFNLIEKIAIPTNSKIAGKKIYQLIKGIDSNAPIKFLSSSSSNDEKKTMSDGEEWKKFDYVIYTPTIGVGVDVSIDHFDIIMAYVTPFSTVPREILQQIGRIRELKKKEILCFIQFAGSTKNWCTDFQKIKENIEKNTNFYFKLSEGLNIDYQIENGYIQKKVQEDFFLLNIYLPNIIEYYKSKNDFVKICC
jgi:hypothetical protein